MKENLRELPSEDPDMEDKHILSLLQEQGELVVKNFLEDPGVEDVVETSRETQEAVVLVFDL